MDFQNSSPFERWVYVYLAISGHFERFNTLTLK